ncbi:hypothetical protein RJ639_032554 [Escallonia herrerae]|uniref:Homeobox-leucine zipper protein n=1 Tax=Escallonia herrerae TaxID=1293975 RepID=A0AA88WWU8_9ASTE|nr:hypothetical protein RJ639_032554 [Escallonia herrerae]
MAGRRLIYGGAGGVAGGGGGGGGGGSNMSSILLQNHSAEPLDSLFKSGSAPSFLGSRSMVSFEDVTGRNKLERSFFRSYDQEDYGDDDYDEYFHQPEKKRRLKADQVQFLEKSFEEENKLEPERKVQLAKDLGLQPRQVAIWFQNRRARWKTKQLEKDYDVLHNSYKSLKADYDNLVKEKEKLKDEVMTALLDLIAFPSDGYYAWTMPVNGSMFCQVLHLTDKLLVKEKEKGSWESSDTEKLSEASAQEYTADLVSEGEVSKNSTPEFKQEDINSANSDLIDSDSPHYADGGHSALLERGDSSYVFEHDQSDLSQDEEDHLRKCLLPPLSYVFPKLEDANYPDPPANSCYFGFSGDENAFEFWSY